MPLIGVWWATEGAPTSRPYKSPQHGLPPLSERSLDHPSGDPVGEAKPASAPGLRLDQGGG